MSSTRAALFPRAGRLGGAGGQGEAHGAEDAHDRGEFGIAALAERFVEALSAQAGILRDTRYAARAGDKAERIAHEIRIAGFQRRGDIGGLPLLRVEIIGRIESRRIGRCGSLTGLGPFGITRSQVREGFLKLVKFVLKRS